MSGYGGPIPTDLTDLKTFWGGAVETRTRPEVAVYAEYLRTRPCCPPTPNMRTYILTDAECMANFLRFCLAIELRPG